MEPSTETVRRPEGLAIKPRRLSFRFDPRTPRYWYAGDPVVTHFLNVLSHCFPDGERFFVDSVRHYKDRVDDPAQKDEIQGFVGQEAMHTVAHERFNEFLGTQDCADILKDAEAMAAKLLRGARLRLTPREQLGATVGLEHATALLADAILGDPERVKALDPSVRTLWTWHCLEELEHKAVAFDLHAHVGGSHTERKVLLLGATFFLAGYSVWYTGRMLHRDRMLHRPFVMARGLLRLFGRGGLVSGQVPAFFDFLDDDFHPWQHANQHLLEQYREEAVRMPRMS